MQKKSIIIAGILILTLGAGAIYSLPYITIYRIIAAFEAKDTQLLSELIDFSQIRDNWKDFAGTKLPSPPPGTRSASWGQIQKSMTSRIIANAVENMITPEGLTSFVHQRLDALVAARDGSDKVKPTAWPLFVALVNHADLGYASPSAFIVAFRGSDIGQIRFILRRNGLAWRLTSME